MWALVSYCQQAVDSDVVRTANDYDVPIDPVRAALRYYASHQEEVDSQILRNSSAVA